MFLECVPGRPPKNLTILEINDIEAQNRREAQQHEQKRLEDLSMVASSILERLPKNRPDSLKFNFNGPITDRSHLVRVLEDAESDLTFKIGFIDMDDHANYFVKVTSRSPSRASTSSGVT